MGSTISWFFLIALAAMLLAACWCDLKARTIPNLLNLAIALLAIPFWWSIGLALWPDVAMQLGVAALVFGLFAIAFALGAMGGGDVKLIAALALWLPLAPLTRMLFIMAVLGGIVTIVSLVVHRMRKASGNPEVPYGIAISLAGLAVLANELLTIPVHRIL